MGILQCHCRGQLLPVLPESIRCDVAALGRPGGETRPQPHLTEELQEALMHKLLVLKLILDDDRPLAGTPFGGWGRRWDRGWGEVGQGVEQEVGQGVEQEAGQEDG